MNEENRTGKCPKAALVLGAIMITIAAVLIGGYGASQLTATYLLDRNIDKDARDMQRQVKALQQLRAGDLAAAELGERALIAGDIVSHLGPAFLWLER